MFVREMLQEHNRLQDVLNGKSILAKIVKMEEKPDAIVRDQNGRYKVCYKKVEYSDDLEWDSNIILAIIPALSWKKMTTFNMYNGIPNEL